jgi:mRNA-degrading endonuclease RelE of RelBE toxin-antitoxin system
MTELLQRVIAELEKLPEDEQDAIATRLLAELEDERAWKVRFESTTNEQWDRLAQMVRQEIVAGDTTPLDEVFPPKQ